MNATIQHPTRPWQATLWLVVGFLVLGTTPGLAQTSGSLLANSSTIEARNADISLQEALRRVANLHDVSFLYQPEDVAGKLVHRRKALPAQLDGQLDRILTPHGLKHTQVGTRSYAIVPRRNDPIDAAASTDAVVQTGTIQGTVRDQSGPLPGVQVVLQGTTRGDVTDPSGAYEIANVPPGDYTLQAKFVGYSTQTVEISVAEDETITQDFTLTQDVMQMDGAVVTGTRTERTQKQTTNSISVLGAEDIQEITPNSQADILRSVPGVHTEGGGGEVASNVFVRGLPAPGQYKYNPIEEDGMPVQSEGRMTTSARDIYFRYDLNVERLEFVRGGSSALFGVGSPAGIINYISKTGSQTPETIIQAQVGQDNLYRFDFNTNGALSEDIRYNLGGFYRYDEGPVVSGLPTEGLQLKGNLTYLQDNGYIRVHAKYLNDQTQFFLPFPHARDDGEAATGNTGNEITTLNSEAAADFSFRGPDGVFESEMEDGITARGAMAMFEFYRDLGNGFTLENKTKWTDMDHTFNIFIPFPAFQVPSEYAAQFIDDPATQRAAWSFTNGDGSFNPSGQITGSGPQGNFIVDQGAWNWFRPFTDLATDLQLTKSLESGDVTHNFTGGVFLSRTQVLQRDTHSSVLNEFADQPRTLDLVIEDAGPDGVFDTEDDTATPVTQNGLSNAASVYVNNQLSTNKIAAYAGDEINFNDRLRVDIGLRYELRQAELVIEGAEAVGENGEFGDALAVQGFQWGNGEFTRQELRSTDYAASLGLNYAVTDVFNIYGVGARGYFFPELASLSTGLEIGDVDNESFWQGEVGVKAGGSQFSGTLALYYTELNDRFASGPREDNDGVIRTVALRVGGSRTLGTELTAAFAPRAVDGLRLSGMFTYQDHEYTDFESGDNDFSGNDIRRQPELMAQGQISYETGGFDAQVRAKYTGERFADEANFQVLDPYTVLNTNIGYTIGFQDNQSVRLGVSVFNLLNSRGLTEGDPRVPAGANPLEQPFFNARPILPRRVTGKITYRL